MTDNERDDAIRIIRAELKRRSGKAWSVKGGTGTAWGWITVTAPPKRRERIDYMSDADAAELGALLGLGHPVSKQGELIPASRDHRIEYIDRARGRDASPTPAYWD